MCSQPAWTMFDGRKIQWFCNQDQKDMAAYVMRDNDVAVPYPLKPASRAHWAAYKESCKVDADCAKPNQYCTKYLWDATKDGKSFAYGSCCYTWGRAVCPAKAPFAELNWNYDGQGEFSYYQQYWCTNTDEIAIQGGTGPG